MRFKHASQTTPRVASLAIYLRFPCHRFDLNLRRNVPYSFGFGGFSSMTWSVLLPLPDALSSGTPFHWICWLAMSKRRLNMEFGRFLFNARHIHHDFFHPSTAMSSPFASASLRLFNSSKMPLTRSRTSSAPTCPEFALAFRTPTSKSP